MIDITSPPPPPINNEWSLNAAQGCILVRVICPMFKVLDSIRKAGDGPQDDITIDIRKGNGLATLFNPIHDLRFSYFE